MKIVNASPGSNLLLGRQGENKAREIVFYIGPWVESYGEGVAQLLHQRKGSFRCSSTFSRRFCSKIGRVVFTSGGI